MTFRLGLTGSIGMGKSTTARIFAEEGCDIWDADAAVHRLYAKGGAAFGPLARAFPAAVTPEGISREGLKAAMAEDASALSRIEAVVHPLVARDRQEFLARTGAETAVFDIPLLFETGGEREMDAVVCVTVPAEVQRQRVLSREGMTEARFQAILERQMPDAEKRARADYIVVTDTPEHAREQVRHILGEIRSGQVNA